MPNPEPIFEQLIGNFVGRVAQGVRPGDPIARHYTRILGQLGTHVLARWSAVSAAGIDCTLIHVQGDVHTRCAMPAAGPCTNCGHMICLEHAMLSPPTGSLLCLGCVQRVPRSASRPQSAGPPPPPHGAPATAGVAVQRQQYLAVLGLEPGASHDEVKARFRKLSKKHHPDTLGDVTPEVRRQAEARFKQMAEAFNWLRQNDQEAA